MTEKKKNTKTSLILIISLVILIGAGAAYLAKDKVNISQNEKNKGPSAEAVRNKENEIVVNWIIEQNKEETQKLLNDCSARNSIEYCNTDEFNKQSDIYLQLSGAASNKLSLGLLQGVDWKNNNISGAELSSIYLSRLTEKIFLKLYLEGNNLIVKKYGSNEGPGGIIAEEPEKELVRLAIPEGANVKVVPYNR